MLKLSGAWLCGLSSVPQGSGLSRLRSSHPRQVSIRGTYERIVIFWASLIVLEDAYWYASRRCVSVRISMHYHRKSSYFHAAHATFCCSCCSIRSISITMVGVRNSFRMFLWCDSGWCFAQLGCVFRFVFWFLPGLIFWNPRNSVAFLDSVGTHVGIKSFQGKNNLVRNSGLRNSGRNYGAFYATYSACGLKTTPKGSCQR